MNSYYLNMKKLGIKDELTDFLLYTSPKGDVKVEVLQNKETVWFAQKSIAQLYGVDRSVITKHLKNKFQSGELEESSVCAKNAHTEDDEKIMILNFYNLDTIISVGYRLNLAYKQKFTNDMGSELEVSPKFEISANRLKITSYGGQVGGQTGGQEAISQEELRNDFGKISERIRKGSN